MFVGYEKFLQDLCLRIEVNVGLSERRVEIGSEALEKEY
jgi:hypothetical protein